MILTSPYVRARDTAKILGDKFAMTDKIYFSENLIPSGNFEALVFEIHEKYDLANVALVGHEPMLSSLSSWLITGETEARIMLKKGWSGISLLGFSVSGWARYPAVAAYSRSHGGDLKLRMFSGCQSAWRSSVSGYPRRG